ncbi:MAG: type I DNA topoisomerase [Planctomycetota bacterium]|nr:MAG: type I DNA topoisomerase [Planctomycetota bacterium]
MKHLVIVESPTKAKKIKDYLGADFAVEASFGHVRDLPQSAKEIPAKIKGEKWARLGIDVDHDFQAVYVVPDDKKAQISKLKKLLEGADSVYLATDEDREGEAIAWHLLDVLKPKVPVSRMVFNEITKAAIQRAVKEARPLDMNLVEAQEARRLLDRLYGYEVSPLLWRKIAPRLSAGRVQSVATKLLVEREKERMAFVAAAWHDVELELEKDARRFAAEITSIGGRKLARGSDFDDRGALKGKDAVVLDAAAAAQIARAVAGGAFEVQEVKSEGKTSSPRGPFTTSTFQQEAGRKLGLRAQEAMRIAQRLYENGYITYMRTDSTSLSREAIDAARNLVGSRYGAEFLPSSPRFYGNQSKNAQEAHEAIRPAGSVFRLPEEVAREVSELEARVYDMIWKRTVACQMADERYTSHAVVLAADFAGAPGGGPIGRIAVVARGRTTDFAGYRRAYVEGRDDVESALDERETVLPPLARGDRAKVASAEPSAHSTAPPSRYTEASLVKRLEELGIGRPSTYASIIDTITSREYAVARDKTLVPTWLAFAVVHVLELLEPVIVDYDFTANMEQRLDRIAAGQLDRLAFLRDFWTGKNPGLKSVVETKADGIDPREVGSVVLGQHEGQTVVVRVGRFGPYVQWKDSRATVPSGLAPDELTFARAIELLATSQKASAPIGVAADGRPVYVRTGRFGAFVQWGDEPPSDGPKVKKARKSAKAEKGAKADKSAKVVKGSAAKAAAGGATANAGAGASAGVDVAALPVKRASLFKSMKPETLTLGEALALLSLPRLLGADPRDGRAIRAKNGRFGPYLEKEPPAGVEKPEYRRIESEERLLTVTLDEASALFAVEPQRRNFRGRAAGVAREPIATLGADPSNQKPVVVKEGKYGPYVTDGETNVTVPRGEDPKALSLERACVLLAQKRAAGPAPKRSGRGRRR